MSVLPAVSKMFERIMHRQMSIFVERFLSSYMCGYRKSFRAQQVLLSLIETWKKVFDRVGYGDAILMDLGKTIDLINYDLLLAKLHANGFTEISLRLMKSYLTNRF